MGKIGLIFLVLLGSGTFRSLRKPKEKRKRNDMRIYNCTGTLKYLRDLRMASKSLHNNDMHKQSQMKITKSHGPYPQQP